jgi:hypothetical protein
MLLDAAIAPRTGAAPDIDLPGDALVDPMTISLGRSIDDADEFVAGDADEGGIAVEHLEVGAADAGSRDANEALTRMRRHRCGAKRQPSGGVEQQGAHGPAYGGLQPNASAAGTVLPKRDR